MKNTNRILVVDDDRATTLLLQRLLAEDGFVVDAAHTGESGRTKTRITPYDGMVLDLALPDVHGISLIEDLRSSGRDVPILVLTSTRDEPTTVRALDAGADDYVTKPADESEIKARVRALVRRGGVRPDETLEVANVLLHRLTRQALVNGQPLSLSPREFTLLEYFMIRVGELVSRAELLDDIDWPVHADPHLMDVHISRLRKKLSVAGAHLSLIARRGHGFTLSSLVRM